MCSSDLLELADRLFEKHRTPGAAVLISDGNATRGEIESKAALLAKRGAPLFCMPLESGGAGVFMSDCFLPARSRAGDETFARVVMRNRLGQSVATALGAKRNGGLAVAGEGDAKATSAPGVIPSGATTSLRQPVVFRGAGLQYVEIEASAAGRESRRRRLFTFVERPPRLLSIGDHGWAQALDSKLWAIDAASPAAAGNALEKGD